MLEIIINKDTQENKTIVVVENGKLVEKYTEIKGQERLEGNIYFGIVENILVGMQAAFINIGKDKNTFIHIRDIIPKASNETGNKNEQLNKHDIKKYIQSGMPIMVQVKRDNTNKKGARVSTHINLSGRYVVIMPNSEFITISKKIENQNERDRLINLAKQELPNGYGVIIRTSAEGKADDVIKKDIQKLLKQWEDILNNFNIDKQKNILTPRLIYKNEGVVEKLITDLIDQELVRIVTNSSSDYEEINKILQEVENGKNIKLELKNENVLEIYDLQTQIEKTENRKIWLKCGGFITIDKTEALTAIDVNSGKYIGNKNLEKTVFTVNQEATVEIAKQIRIRDIGGIIIIDYIDMENNENKQKIIELLEENLKKDRSKTQIVGFTPLHLLEMTRKHMWSND